MTKTILVTGGNGQLGSELKDLANVYTSYRFVFSDRDEMSITDEASVRQAFEKERPDFLVNCAAYTAVDLAETEKETANEINGKAVGILAGMCKEFGSRFVHISTDYVFSGKEQRPLLETDAVDPVNAYGESKLLGERLALQYEPASIIIRTAWVYSAHGKNFVKTMMRLMAERESISVVSDQFGSPTYAADLAQLIMTIIDSGRWEPGIYNFSNEGIINWFDFAVEIKKQTGAACTVNPISTDMYPTPARRPAYSVLDKSKVRRVYGVQPANWQESLRHCIGRLNAAATS